MLFEFAFSKTSSEVGTVNRNVELLKDIRKRAEMILVSVSEDDGGYVLPIRFEKLEVRNRNINAVSRLFMKAHYGVEDNHLVAISKSHAIHSKLTNTAEWNDL